MEVGKNQNPLTFLVTLGTNNKNLAIGRIFFRNLANFFMENPSYTLKS